jgi:ATP-binding cassette subfamily F protein uup
MNLLSLQNISLAYGLTPLLEKANFTITARQRICVIGRNGAGKSTLFKLLNQETDADSGEINRMPDLKISKLRQDIPQGLTGTLYQTVAAGLGKLGDLLTQYHAVIEQVAEDASPAILEKLQKVQTQIDLADAWQVQQKVDSIITKMNLNPEANMDALSGGMIRRVLLAQALVAEPDILLLDEPTNHLDITAIEWLETFLANYDKTIIFITHDRSLVQKIATQIVELDNGHLQVWDCNYTQYLERKAELLAAEGKANALFDKRLAEEEKWIRKGIQARRTRDEGRVRRLQQMRRDRAQRYERLGKANFEQQKVNYSGKMVFEIENLHYEINGQTIINDFSAQIMRGDKIGIIGDNGCGKTTLLKLLLSDLKPTSGILKCGTKLDVSYFDQKRAQLDENKSVIDNVSPSSEFVEIGGKSKHIISYLNDFLFTPERARTPVKALSGGERHRLLLARVFTKACNLLILDEPTNDLDAETLELLEERLMDYDGTLLLVSHDRAFINNVVTSTLVFDGKGNLQEFVGDYDDYVRQAATLKQTPAVKKTVNKIEKASTVSAKKLNYKEQRELEQLPAKIQALEAGLSALQSKLSDNDFYQQDTGTVSAAQKELATLEAELKTVYARWEQLEN